VIAIAKTDSKTTDFTFYSACIIVVVSVYYNIQFRVMEEVKEETAKVNESAE